VIDSASAAAAQVQPIYAAAIVCGSMHQSKYQASLAHFVRSNAAWLTALPAAFVSVSLTAVLTDAESRAELNRIADEFFAETGWTPGVVQQVPGALLYTRYDYFKRFAMRLIAKQQGGDTDTSRDFEYTDWNALKRFVDEFQAAVPAAQGGR
jgi:menaquinone-dependent protoporphyrinogen oxidase